jgi:glycosyltransferase involved in cell wall biosynthesis
VSSRPRFSVAIPTYNRLRNFLPDAIGGALNQSFPDFELLVSDNGSSDGTAGYVRSLRDPRIRLIDRHRTIPAGEHFAALAKEAVGEYLVLHQDDDLLHRDFLKRADAAFSAHPEAVMYGSPIWRQVHGHGYHSRLMRPRQGHDDRRLLQDELIVFDGEYAAIQFFDPIRHFVHPTLAVSNAALVSVGGYDPGADFQSDLVTQARVLFKGPLVYDPQPGGVSRVHPANFMRTQGRAFRKRFFRNSYIQLIAVFDSARVPWQPLLEEYLGRLSEKEVLACLFEWTYYRAPLELRNLGFAALRRGQRSTLRYLQRCLTKLGVRNLVRHWISRSRVNR